MVVYDAPLESVGAGTGRVYVQLPKYASVANGGYGLIPTGKNASFDAVLDVLDGSVNMLPALVVMETGDPMLLHTYCLLVTASGSVIFNAHAYWGVYDP
jgi:hypothetical protein